MSSIKTVIGAVHSVHNTNLGTQDFRHPMAGRGIHKALILYVQWETVVFRRDRTKSGNSSSNIDLPSGPISRTQLRGMGSRSP
jgi:hypothetical protein